MSRFIITVVLCLVAQPACGQDLGKLKGRVVDVLGAAIAKATITIKNSEGKNQVVTNEDGEFEIQLPVGIYEIRTEKMSGFLPSKYAKVRMRRSRDKRITIKVMHTLEDAVCILKITSH